jgi:uncharacterized protein YdeI (YjbR/CyaY-like superfamily)
MTSHGKDGLPILGCADRAQWAAWLERNHALSKGVWLKLARNASGLAAVRAAREDGRWEAA